MKEEELLSRAVRDYLAYALPKTAFATVFPAGGGGRRRGAALKGMGMIRGCPDWIIIYKGHAHWIELKSRIGKLSPSQKEVHATLETAGCFVETCKSVDEVESALRTWRIPLRAEL